MFDLHRSTGSIFFVCSASTLPADAVYLNYVPRLRQRLSRRGAVSGDSVACGRQRRAKTLERNHRRVRGAYPGRTITESQSAAPDRRLSCLSAPAGDEYRLGDTIAWVHPLTGNLVERSDRTRNGRRNADALALPLHSGTASAPWHGRDESDRRDTVADVFTACGCGCASVAARRSAANAGVRGRRAAAANACCVSPARQRERSSRGRFEFHRTISVPGCGWESRVRCRASPLPRRSRTLPRNAEPQPFRRMTRDAVEAWQASGCLPSPCSRRLVDDDFCIMSWVPGHTRPSAAPVLARPCPAASPARHRRASPQSLAAARRSEPPGQPASASRAGADSIHPHRVSGAQTRAGHVADLRIGGHHDEIAAQCDVAAAGGCVTVARARWSVCRTPQCHEVSVLRFIKAKSRIGSHGIGVGIGAHLIVLAYCFRS